MNEPKNAMRALAAAIALTACGTDDPTRAPTNGTVNAEVEPTATVVSPVLLAPRLELVGLADVFDDLVVTGVRFDAEIYLLPEGKDPALSGDMVPVHFEFEGGRAKTTSPDGQLKLTAAGNYRVLVRVRGEDGGPSVEIEGGLLRAVDATRAKAETPEAEEPTPSPAQPLPSTDEPTPSPAEPTPSPAEPTPSPAEPTPSTDEPTPSPARGKPGDEDTRELVSVRSSRVFEFHAGQVAVSAASENLVVTWDVRTWLRALLATPLGRPASDPAALPSPDQPGFSAETDDFRVIAR
ncbi:MAG: hypothetical protein EXR76_01895 [Myxococcales bacterium]|nr:hypothetical protein [Myxococcales bacterium]